MTKGQKVSRAVFSKTTRGDNVRSMNHALHFAELLTPEELKNVLNDRQAEAGPVRELDEGHLATQEEILEGKFLQETASDTGVTNCVGCLDLNSFHFDPFLAQNWPLGKTQASSKPE